MTAGDSFRSTATTALFVLWGLFCLAMTVVAMQDGLRNPYVHWWQPLLWEGSSLAMGTLLLLVQRRVNARYEQFLDRPWLWFLHHLKWFPPLALIFIAAIYAIRHGVYALAGETYRHESWGYLLVYESIKFLLFGGLWLGIIFGLNSFTQWGSQRERLLEVQKALAESQLRQLQSQLRPHFLFNALNTISSLMHTDPARADRLLVRLGDLLRASLQVDRDQFTALREEVRILNLYAQIMQERFVDRVRLQWDIDPDTLDVAVPSLLLQPLLENAFKHGVERSPEPVSVQVASHRSGEQLVFHVSNTGELDGRQEGSGIGLRNCEARLRLLYGDSAAVTLAQESGQVRVRVTLPWRRHVAADVA